MWQKYIVYMLSGECRAYSDNIPDYLKEFERKFIIRRHQDTIEQGKFEVFKGDGGKRSVNFNIPACSCKDIGEQQVMYRCQSIDRLSI